jgi:hypothetical protein
MRTSIFLLLLLATALSVSSQAVTYDYDQTGNRIVRSSNAALPVRLVTFLVSIEEAWTLVKWEAAEEKGFLYFEVERSADSKTWQVIGMSGSTENGEFPQRYQLRDPEPLEGRNFYRLKMVDTDGTYSYSGVRSVFFEFESDVYPNPVRDFLKIRDPEKVVAVSVLSFDGKPAFEAGGFSGEGLDFRFCPPGFYIVKVSRRNGVITTYRVVKD